eukprot:PhF_6_TR43014/c0_g1_i2/m.65738
MEKDSFQHRKTELHAFGMSKKTYKSIGVLIGHREAVYAVAYSPDDEKIISASGDETCLLWNAKTFQKLFTIPAHSSSVSAVSFSRHGLWILTASVSGEVTLWDSNTYLKLHEWCDTTIHENVVDVGVNHVYFSADSTTVLVSHKNGKTVFLDAPSLTLTSSINARTSRNTSASIFTKTQDQIIISHDDCTVHVVDSRRDVAYAYDKYSNFVTGVCFSSDGDHVYTTTIDGTISYWELMSGTKIWETQRLFNDGSRVHCCAIDEGYLLVGVGSTIQFVSL